MKIQSMEELGVEFFKKGYEYCIGYDTYGTHLPKMSKSDMYGINRFT